MTWTWAMVSSCPTPSDF